MGIPMVVLRGAPLSQFNVSERLAWVEKRNTTREEDKAYSLFGLFDVQLPLLYGEGEGKTFKRLREEIARTSTNPTSLCRRPRDFSEGREGQ